MNCALLWFRRKAFIRIWCGVPRGCAYCHLRLHVALPRYSSKMKALCGRTLNIREEQPSQDSSRIAETTIYGLEFFGDGPKHSRRSREVYGLLAHTRSKE